MMKKKENIKGKWFLRFYLQLSKAMQKPVNETLQKCFLGMLFVYIIIKIYIRNNWLHN